MIDTPQLQSVLSDEEAEQMLRDSIVALLSRDPHCPVANLLGQALMDL